MAATADHLDLSYANLHRLLDDANEVVWARVAHLRCAPFPHDRHLHLCLDLTRVARRAGVKGTIPTPARLHALVQRQAQVKRRNRYAWRF